MSSSFPLEVLDSGKSALISSYLNVSTTETESNFWKKLAMMQNSDYNPENMHKDETYENEKGSYENGFEHRDFGEPENGAFDHNALPSLSVRSTDESTEKEIRSFVTEIIKTAEDECDDKFWRDYEAKLYGKWLKIENSSEETPQEKRVNNSISGGISKKDISDEFWRNYEARLYNKWLKIDDPQDYEYIKERTSQMTKALLIHLGLNNNDMKTVPTDVEENMAKKLTPSPIGDHVKKMKKRKNKSGMSRFFCGMFSCFRRRKDEN